ncbi:V4R domain-containing protein, partial [Acinetobacter baumannii]
VFAVGPQLHALEGFVAVEPVRIDIDVERGVHYVEQIWHDSAEALAHIEAVGFSSEAVCWMQVGYASGFNSALFGRPILFKEIECSGTGAAHCRI